jgi:archaellum component FlaC
LAKRGNIDLPMAEKSTENELLAQELDHIARKLDALESRMTVVEEVIPRLEKAAQTTARAMEEISEHWDAVYRAMRRAE